MQNSHRQINSGRIGWIDFVRGASMMAIIAFHTEVYYRDALATPYYVYTTNAIVLFYFISGYLFYRPQHFSLSRKLSSIGATMLCPYFIFTTLLAVPKLLIRHENVEWQAVAANILAGHASWFIAALMVAEVVFALLLHLSRGSQCWLFGAAVGSLAAYFIVPFSQFSFWQWQDALLALPFLCVGYACHRHLDVVSRWLRPVYSAFLLLVLVGIKTVECHLDLPMRNIAVDCAPLFVADTFITLAATMGLVRLIPRCGIVEWTGRHSLLYYFLCGGCPFVVSMLLTKAGIPYDNSFLRYVLAFLLAYTLATALVWLIHHLVAFCCPGLAKFTRI